MATKIAPILIRLGFIVLAWCGGVNAHAELSAAKMPAVGILYLADHQDDAPGDAPSPFDNAAVEWFGRARA